RAVAARRVDAGAHGDGAGVELAADAELADGLLDGGEAFVELPETEERVGDAGNTILDTNALAARAAAVEGGELDVAVGLVVGGVFVDVRLSAVGVGDLLRQVALDRHRDGPVEQRARLGDAPEHGGGERGVRERVAMKGPIPAVFGRGAGLF